MKRISLLLLLFTLVLTVKAQKGRSPSLSIAYFGEMLTHPGVKFGLNYNLLGWTKNKRTRERQERSVDKNLLFQPSLGIFYHERYQAGLMVLPEWSLLRQNERGGHFSVGAGVGYLRTFIPNTYEATASGEVNKVVAGHDYLLTSCFVAFGKDFSVQKDLLFGYFIKPQFLYATPNFPKGVGYFALELGLHFKL